MATLMLVRIFVTAFQSPDHDNVHCHGLHLFDQADETWEENLSTYLLLQYYVIQKVANVKPCTGSLAPLSPTQAYILS